MVLTVLFTIASYVGAVCLFLVIGWYVYIQRFAKYFRNIPGPTPLPVIGNALLFTDPNKVIAALNKIREEYGGISKILIGIEPLVLLSNYKALETVLSSAKLLEKSKLYKFLHSWLGTGLLTSDGIKWKKRRRLMTPSYHFQILEQFVSTFNRVSNQLVEELKKVPNKQCVDIYPFITLSTLDVICETAMGVSVNALKQKDSSYVKSVKEMGRITMERVFSPVQQIQFLYQFTSNYHIEQASLKVLHGHTMDVIRKRRAELKQSPRNETSQTNDEFGSKKKVAFLDLLLQTTDNGVPLTDDDIREEVDTFMFEGHDTTASGISFTLFEIAKHPEVQAKIYAEQLEVLGGDINREPSYQDLSSMRYLEMVIKESLRMYPSVPLYAREAFEDIQITDDVCIPKGSTIGILAFQVHRDPDYFPEPDKFIPERFLPENNSGRMPYSFIPFSAGPRNCIGQKFAYMELKSTIGKVVKHFELFPVTPTHEPQLVLEAVLKSNNGVLVGLKQRN